MSSALILRYTPSEHSFGPPNTSASGSVGTESDGRSTISGSATPPSTKGTTESQPCQCQGPPQQGNIELVSRRAGEHKEAEPGATLPGPCAWREVDEREGEEEPLNFDDTLEQAESSFREATAKNNYWAWCETQQNWYHGPAPEQAEIWYPSEWLPSASSTSPEAGGFS